jgi:hypothetical protein
VAATHGLLLDNARAKLAIPSMADIFVTDTIESTVPRERGKSERDPHAPLPEEETYERERRDQRPRS